MSPSGVEDVPTVERGAICGREGLKGMGLDNKEEYRGRETDSNNS